jgi:hypothetical protein
VVGRHQAHADAQVAGFALGQGRHFAREIGAREAQSLNVRKERRPGRWSALRLSVYA